METATLIVKLAGNKKVTADVRLRRNDEHGQPIIKTIPKEFKANELPPDGTTVEVEIVGETLVKVQANGRFLYLGMAPKNVPSAITKVTPPSKTPSKPLSQQSRPMSSKSGGPVKHTERIQAPAHAPYNFIPLNEKVVTAPEPVPAGNTYHHNKHTGWIDLDIETITPLYIRGTLNQDELNAGTEAKDISRFFAPGGQLRIPGSSLRGMVRTLVDIVSFGKFGAFNDRRLYYRSFADTTSLRDEYVPQMTQTVQGAYTIKAKAGYLRRGEHHQFVIVPAITKDQTTFYRVEESLLLKNPSLYPQAMSILEENVKTGRKYHKPNPRYKFLTVVVDFKKTTPRPHGRQYYGEVTDIVQATRQTPSQGWERGTLVCSGWMQKKRRQWVINLIHQPNQAIKPLPIDELLMRSYNDDKDRYEEANLLRQLDAHPEGVPCFYTTDSQGQVVSFGHTGLFRLAYKRTIGDHVLPEELLDEAKLDFAEAILGRVDQKQRSFAGRVFFEDAMLCEAQGNVLMGEQVPKILSTPKPTTFQHYLVQTSSDPLQLNHYNTQNAPIRGNKLYWHRSGTNWQESGDQKQLAEKIKARKDTQHTIINPVRKDTRFTGRIRFENLSEVELGALLFVLDLPDGCYHKLGMGKPLGLGSVKITPTVQISNRKDRYIKLFEEWERRPEPAKTNRFKNDFAKFVLDKLEATQLLDASTDDTRWQALWQTERLQELETMLNYKKGLERQKNTVYMQIQGPQKNDFKDRRVLPLPSQVKTG